MTPKQREVFSSLQEQIGELESDIGCLRRKLHTLPDYFDTIQDKGEFTTNEINELLLLNHRLAELDLYLSDLSAKECASLAVRVSDNNDPLNDYEIDATLFFTLREDEIESNFLAQRKIDLKHLDKEWGLGDRQDYRETVCHFPGVLNEVSHCWLFHDLYDHSYCLQQPALNLQDCLRVGKIWVDVAVRHQSTLDIKSGKWQKY